MLRLPNDRARSGFSPFVDPFRAVLATRFARSLVAVAVAATTFVIGAPANAVAAVSFNAATDFSPTANPNGVWSYGWSASRGSTFSLLTHPVNQVGLGVWSRTEPASEPDVAHNGTNTTISPACCNPIPPGGLVSHPGPNGENAIVRWTAPTSGLYTVTATFSGVDTAGTSTDVAVLHSGAQVFSAAVNGYGSSSAQSFSATISVLGGDTIDFTVGFGADGTYLSDTTAIDAVITPVGGNTTTHLASSMVHSVFGQSVTLTAIVTAPPPATVQPSGTVAFYDGTILLGTGALNEGSPDIATFQTSGLAVGTHSLSAVYREDVIFSGSTSDTVSQIVSRAPTTTAVTSSENPSQIDHSVTYIATTVAGNPGSGTPTGRVQFSDGGSALGECTSVAAAGGQAACRVTYSVLGSHSITATYSGDTNFVGSASPVLGQAVATFRCETDGARLRIARGAPSGPWQNAQFS